MKRALIISRNLIGDALNAGVAIREWFRVHRDDYDEVDLLTTQDHVTCIYKGLGVEWSHIFTDKTQAPFAGEKWDYDKVFVLGAGDAGKYCDANQCHIIDGFCSQLGINPPHVELVRTQWGDFKGYHLFYNPWRTLDSIKQDIPGEENLVLFSPFSASCSSRKGEPPNKMLQPEHWVPILNYLRTLGKLRMLGAPDDEPDKSWQLSEDEIFTGIPLDVLAIIMKKARLVVTIDNGMGHLASSQDAKHILFYPMCLSLNFIIPWGADYTIPIQVEPTQVQPQQLMWSVTKAVKVYKI